MNYDPKTTDTRACSRCDEEQHLGQFVEKNSSKIGGWQSRTVCKACRKIQDKPNQQKYHRNNRTKIIERAAAFKVKARTRNYSFVNRVKKNALCADCRTDYPYYILQFDHVVNDNENTYIAKLVASPVSIKRLKDEIRQCEIVCANCHKMRTQKRRWEGTHLVFGKQYNG